MQLLWKRTVITVSRLSQMMATRRLTFGRVIRRLILLLFRYFYITILGNSWKQFSSKKVQPDAGLEPATVGLKVQRSTDWANQARLSSRRTLDLFQWELTKLRPVGHTIKILSFTVKALLRNDFGFIFIDSALTVLRIELIPNDINVNQRLTFRFNKPGLLGYLVYENLNCRKNFTDQWNSLPN